MEPSPDGRRMLAAWQPSAPFGVVVYYRAPGRRPDRLWVTPYQVGPDGKPFYLAAGPAGEPIGSHLVRTIDMRSVPRDVHVEVVMEQSPTGELVYGVPNHTAN